MRWALGLLLCCATLAGCTAGDDPRPPNADPFPGESHPPRPSTSTPPSTETHTNPPPSNATTSTQTSTAPPASSRFGPHDQEDGATDPRFSGLLLGGRLAGSGALVEVQATANNVGERSYRVPDGCRTPWAESMAGPSGAVQAREPLPECAGFTYREFPGHDFLSRTFEWNGTLWDSTAGAYVAAPSGTYTWRIVFDVYGGPGDPPQDHAALTLEFQVTVQ
jgi:hypothetical protein